MFVTCGEALIDLVPTGEGDAAATTWTALSAGGPMNTAIALARLGRPTAMCVRLGSDGFARQLADHLAGNHVSSQFIVHADAPTTMAIVSLDAEGRASYTFHFAGTSCFGWRPGEPPRLPDGAWLHLASIGTVVEPSASILRTWAVGQSGRLGGLSWDINVRPTVIPRPDDYWAVSEPWLRELGQVGAIVKASDEDIDFLALADGCPSGDPVGVAQAWVNEYGLAAVIITLGPDGAAAVLGDGSILTRPGRSVDVVDTVGAGDTFMAGFLDGCVEDPHRIADALDRGIAAAAIVCGRRGANPPTAAEVDALLAG